MHNFTYIYSYIRTKSGDRHIFCEEVSWPFPVRYEHLDLTRVGLYAPSFDTWNWASLPEIRKIRRWLRSMIRHGQQTERIRCPHSRIPYQLRDLLSMGPPPERDWKRWFYEDPLFLTRNLDQWLEQLDIALELITALQIEHLMHTSPTP